MDLSQVDSPEALKSLPATALPKLASQLRTELIEQVSQTGGHLGPNLGVVEITIALHRVFSSPRDAIVFDTGHQSYVHKMLTGRRDLSSLRQRNGIAGYPQRSESIHDIVENSHASTSLSWADGISKAFAATGQLDRHVIAVIGDGALTGGMAWEALNNITDDNDRNLIIVVNDNGRSYAPTIGGFAKSLSKIRRKSWRNSKFRLRARILGRMGLIRRGIFPNLGIKYIGPIDGHDIAALERALRSAKAAHSPVVVHTITEKGRGYQPALNDQADQFHAVGKINPETGMPIKPSTSPTWTDVFSSELVSVAAQSERVVGITGAMLIPVGMDAMAERFPNRVFDVGIAEQHATTAAAGMAYGGLHPVVAVYSTFLNRAFDQLLMDVALHKAGVTFVLDRAGITGSDGASHHGVWDLAMLQVVPGIAIATPRDENTLRLALREAVEVDDAPTVIRFPKGLVTKQLDAVNKAANGSDVLFQSASKDVLLVGLGPFAHTAVEVAQALAQHGIGATVIDPRWVLPISPDLITAGADHRLVVTIEDGVRVGGFGSRLRQVLREHQIDTALHEVGIPAEFLEHAERPEILERLGLEAKSIARDLVEQVLGTRVPKAKPLDSDSSAVQDQLG